jgi:hypothetical protein
MPRNTGCKNADFTEFCGMISENEILSLMGHITAFIIETNGITAHFSQYMPSILHCLTLARFSDFFGRLSDKKLEKHIF